MKNYILFLLFLGMYPSFAINMRFVCLDNDFDRFFQELVDYRNRLQERKRVINAALPAEKDKFKSHAYFRHVLSGHMARLKQYAATCDRKRNYTLHDRIGMSYTTSVIFEATELARLSGEYDLFDHLLRKIDAETLQPL
jgi:hypothetical protein